MSACASATARCRSWPRRSESACWGLTPRCCRSFRGVSDDLRSRGRLLKAESYEHSYPHCWRCGTPLLYYAKPSWYIATSRIKDRLLAANETVNWYPDHVKHGRFGNWLEGNVDWAL